MPKQNQPVSCSVKLPPKPNTGPDQIECQWICAWNENKTITVNVVPTEICSELWKLTNYKLKKTTLNSITHTPNIYKASLYQ